MYAESKCWEVGFDTCKGRISWLSAGARKATPRMAEATHEPTGDW